MKVFLAGATGAIGRQLVPQLVAAGHEVFGLTRTPTKQASVRELGATPLIADALDPDQVAQAVAAAEPEAIVHQLTAIGSLDPRHFDRDFALTNRLRTEGTDHLLAAGRAVGVRRFLAQRTRSTPSRRARCVRRCRRSATSRRRCWGLNGPRGSSCATARSAVRAPRWRPAVSSSR
jgi:nucleoside-diphosphate-sugar epimerase